MGTAACSYVAGRFSLEHVAKMEMALLEELAAEHRSPRVVTSEVSRALALARRADTSHE
jgi:hypothetical protein